MHAQVDILRAKGCKIEARECVHNDLLRMHDRNKHLIKAFKTQKRKRPPTPVCVYQTHP